jgi:hypothetical protein
MLPEYKKWFRFLTSAILWSLAVHAIFILQGLVAMQERGMLCAGWPEYVFYPHAVLMVSLPPGYPFNDPVVSNWKIVGKFVDAYPASFVYGAAITLLVNWLREKFQRLRPS